MPPNTLLDNRLSLCLRRGGQARGLRLMESPKWWGWWWLVGLDVGLRDGCTTMGPVVASRAAESPRFRYGVTGVLALLLACAPPDAKAGLGPIEPSPIVQLVVAPPSATVDTGGVLNFSASAVHEDGTNSVPAVTWSATGGVITTDGVYTPGAAAGNFSVTASLAGGTLTRSAAVTVVAPTSPLVSIAVSPPSTSLFTGETQQFLVTGTRQDGSTLVPSVVWTATGGGISASGLYSGGGAAGLYMVVATQQGGSLADTSVVTLSAPSGGPYPHRPANFTNSREIDFSQVVPTYTDPQNSHAIVGATGWYTTYDTDGAGGSNFSRLSDAAAPRSPSGVWQMHFQPGTYASGHGSGNIWTDIPGSPTAVYISVWHKVDPNFVWHPISNKFLWLSPGQILVQIEGSGKWLHGQNLNASQWLDPSPANLNGAVLLTYKNDPVTRGVWHHYEVVIDKAARTFKIWMDGDLKTSATNLTFAEGYFSQFNFTAHRGGGGETLTRDVYWYYDHVTVAWP